MCGAKKCLPNASETKEKDHETLHCVTGSGHKKHYNTTVTRMKRRSAPEDAQVKMKLK